MISCIINQLQTLSSVYINDLGTFTVNYVPAQIDYGTIVPPHNAVVFDNTADHDEIAFTNFVCQQRQCLLTEGNAAICQWVDELKTALANNKSISYEGFGTFSLQKNGEITFQSDRIPALNVEFEGMGVIVTEPIVLAEEEVAPEPEETNSEPEEITSEPEEITPEPEEIAPELQETNTAPEEITSEPEEVTPTEPSTIDDNETIMDTNEEEEEEETDEDEDEDEDDDDDNNDRKVKSHWWLFVLIILIALGALALVFKDQLIPVYQQVKHKITHQTEQVDSNQVQQPEAEIEEADKEVNVAEEVSVEETPYEPETVKSTTDGNYPYIQFERGHYYAIAGSLPTEADAQRHIRQAGLAQYSPKLLLQDGVSNIRVCIGIFNTEEEALSFAKGINSKYWVLK